MKKNNFSRKSDFKLPPLEQELILSHILKKSREYVLTHPEIQLSKKQEQLFATMSARRLKNEPMAYILGRKEFYGLDFKVTRHTLIPRPETELLVEELIKLKHKNCTIIDIGTGSGNIIISIAKNLKFRISNLKFIGVDISSKALKIAKYNAKKHGVDKKIRFFKSNLLNYFLNNLTIKPFNNLIIVANLPYLSNKIYNSAKSDVKNFEPKIALSGGDDGLDHYKNLFKQIKTLKKNCSMFHACLSGRQVLCYMEISPEQKNELSEIIKRCFPKSKPKFQKDMAQKWRIAYFSI
jgi:release factor glutamine methyltransferase